MKNKGKQPVPAGPLGALPPVTVQLPMYNEMYVAERLLEGVVARLSDEQLEIQVLDDSTDETTEIAEQAVRRSAAGFDVTFRHRTDRTGFKAGALEEGLNDAKGDYVMVFDADFVPTPSIVTRTIPHFTDPKVGMVQARWGHSTATTRC